MHLLPLACVLALASSLPTSTRAKPTGAAQMQDDESSLAAVLYAIFSVLESDTSKQILWTIGRSDADHDRMCRTVSEIDPEAFADLSEDEYRILVNLCQQPPQYARLFHKYLDSTDPNHEYQ